MTDRKPQSPLLECGRPYYLTCVFMVLAILSFIDSVMDSSENLQGYDRLK